MARQAGSRITGERPAANSADELFRVAENGLAIEGFFLQSPSCRWADRYQGGRFTLAVASMCSRGLALYDREEQSLARADLWRP